MLTWNIRSEDEDQFKGVEWAFFKAHHDGADFVLLLGTQVSRARPAVCPPLTCGSGTK